MDTHSFSAASVRHMEGVHEDLVRCAHEALKLTKIDFGIPSTGGRRTAEEQRGLYDRGVSNADGSIYVSPHQHGLALDVFAWVEGEVSYEKEHLAQVAAAFLLAANRLGVRVMWGGLFKDFEDMPHFELEKR